MRGRRVYAGGYSDDCDQYHDAGSQVNVITRRDVAQGKVSFNQFVAQTWRFFFYALALTVAGAALAFGFPIPVFEPVLAITLEIIPFLGFMWCHYVLNDYSKAFYFFLAFAGLLGLVLGPQLALIAATIPNGMFIIISALCTTLGMTFMLHNYAWLSLQLNFRQVTLFGSFLSTALTGLLIIGLVSLIFPTPMGMLLYSAAGVGVFSLYMVYDVYLLKIGAFKTPVEAAMNLFLDVINLFLETLTLYLVLNSENKDNAGTYMGQFFVKRLLPIVAILALVLTFGLIENWAMKKAGAQVDESPNDGVGPAPAPQQQLPHNPGYSPYQDQALLQGLGNDAGGRQQSPSVGADSYLMSRQNAYGQKPSAPTLDLLSECQKPPATQQTASNVAEAPHTATYHYG